MKNVKKVPAFALVVVERHKSKRHCRDGQKIDDTLH